MKNNNSKTTNGLSEKRNEVMPHTSIDDPLGLDSGIRVTNVRCVLDRDNDRILISGRMSGNRILGLDIEPDLQCDILKNDQVCLSACSVHQGVFAITRRVTFTTKIEAVSERVAWNEINEIFLYVIFRRSNHYWFGYLFNEIMNVLKRIL